MADNRNLSKWFLKSQNPTIVGEYEFKYVSGYVFRAFWDGAKWLIRDEKDKWFWDREIVVGGEWRGLANKQKGAK